MAKEIKKIIPRPVGARRFYGARRGDIYLVNFDPSVGSEIKKTRPALILQNNITNRYSPVTIVAAITSQFTQPSYPTEVFVKASLGGLNVDSVVLLNQIRTIDKRRLVKRLGFLNGEIMNMVDKALQISLGLVDI